MIFIVFANIYLHYLGFQLNRQRLTFWSASFKCIHLSKKAEIVLRFFGYAENMTAKALTTRF